MLLTCFMQWALHTEHRIYSVHVCGWMWLRSSLHLENASFVSKQWKLLFTIQNCVCIQERESQATHSHVYIRLKRFITHFWIFYSTFNTSAQFSICDMRLFYIHRHNQRMFVVRGWIENKTVWFSESESEF